MDIFAWRNENETQEGEGEEQLPASMIRKTVDGQTGGSRRSTGEGKKSSIHGMSHSRMLGYISRLKYLPTSRLWLATRGQQIFRASGPIQLVLFW